jgi:hypothetical protein
MPEPIFLSGLKSYKKKRTQEKFESKTSKTESRASGKKHHDGF